MTINFGVIGCGRMGKRRATAISQNGDATLLKVADDNAELAQVLATELKSKVAASAEEIINDSTIDCVVISCPNYLHEELVTEAFKNKKHVFCEKPLARNAKEAVNMVLAAKKAGKLLTVGSNLRYFPSILKAKELLGAKAIGETIFLRTWIGHQGWNLGGTWFSDPEKSGGGTFLDNGCHVLDITRWFLGEVESCVGQVMTGKWDIPVEDNGVGIFKTADGKMATIQASWSEWNGYNYMEVYGTEGYIKIDNRGRSCITVLGNTKAEETVFDFSNLPANSFKDEFDTFIANLKEGKQSHPSGFDGMRAVQMAHAVYESSKKGERVLIPESYS